MKKYTGFLFLAITILALSCKKDDATVFTDSPNARATAALAGYQKILTDATTGWKGVLYPAGDTTKAFSFYFKFDNSNRVKMLSDFTDSFSTVIRESSYRLKALQNPALIFDTYSYLHVLSDPDPSSSGNGGAVGEGLNADFEFEFDSSKTKVDAMTLMGRQHNSILRLTKLTAAEATIATSTGFAGGTMFSNINKYLTYFKRFTLNGVTYEVQANTVARTITFNWLDASGNLQSITRPFIYGFDGISFSTPLSLGNNVIPAFTAMTWDPVNLVLGFKINGTIVTLQQAIAPIKIDLTAAQKWYAQMNVNFNGCWVSDKAFHVNGVDDFCQFGNVTSAGTTVVAKGSTQLWFAGSGLFAANPYDGFIAFVNAFASNASLPSPYFVNDRPITINGGIATFFYFGAAGTFTGAAGTLAYSMTSARSIVFYTTSGTRTVGNWYIIPTTADGLHYDMVRVSDAQAWISWRPR